MMEKEVVRERKPLPKTIFRVFVLLSSLFVWFLYSFYTLDYSTGNPVISNSSIVLLLLVLVFNFREAFLQLLRKVPKNKMVFAGVLGIIFGEFLYSFWNSDLLTSVVQGVAVYLIITSFYRKREYVISAILSALFGLLFYTGRETVIDTILWISLVVSVIASSFLFVSSMFKRKR